jgi:hypothetical protein
MREDLSYETGVLTPHRVSRQILGVKNSQIVGRKTARMVMNSTQVSELELEDFQGKVTQNIL